MSSSTCDTDVSLIQYIDTQKVNSINNHSSTFVKSVLSANEGILRSDDDVDHEMILVLPFREKVKIKSLGFVCRTVPSTSGITPDSCSGVKTVKIFINQPSYTFDDCKSCPPTQVLEFNEKQIKDGVSLPVKFVKFQNVDSITIFIESNQKDSAVTYLNSVLIAGMPVIGLNMNNIKKSG